jgi:acyl transferase domain-containing protein/acyl carrier protein
MGRELHGVFPVYAEAFDEVCELLAGELDVPLASVVFGECDRAGELLEHTAYAQPALFAVEVALYRLLESCGLAPGLLAGHSVGELAAAHVAGVLSLDDAVTLVAARGRLMGELPAGGAMVALQASEEEVVEALVGEAGVSVAAVNGPASVVISGEASAVDGVAARFVALGRRTKALAVSHAFHSCLIDPMLERFAEVAGGLEYGESRIPIVSGVDGELLGGERVIDAAYWVRQAREPVRFADAVGVLRAREVGVFLEVGPGAALSGMVAECLQADDDGDDGSAVAIGLLREGREERYGVARAVAEAYANGVAIDWDALFAGTSAKRVALPTYPFERKRYWLSPAKGARDLDGVGLHGTEHPLVGAALEDPRGGVTLSGRIAIDDHSWLVDHAVAGVVLLPGTAFLELALRAGGEAGCGMVRELALQAPLVVPERGGVQVQVVVGEPGGGGERELSIYSRAETAGGERQEQAAASEWVCHAQGVVAPEPSSSSSSSSSSGGEGFGSGLLESLSSPAADVGVWPVEGARPLGLEGLYERLAQAGFEYGPAFQNVTAAWERDGEVFAEVSLADEQALEAGRYGVHPALLDAAAHAAVDVALTDAAREQHSAGGGAGGLVLPFAWRGIRVGRRGATSLRVCVRPGSAGTDGALVAYDESGELAIAVSSVAVRPVDPGQLRAAARRRSLYCLRWPEIELPTLEGPGSISTEGSTPPEGSTSAEGSTSTEGSLRGGVFELSVRAGEDPVVAGARLAGEVLVAVQDWLASGPEAGDRFVVLTRGGVCAREGELVDPAQAAVWGLLRSAQSEHPGRIYLVDTDGSDASARALDTALSQQTEPQLALREGAFLVPRLARTDPTNISSSNGDGGGGVLGDGFDAEGTVLVTGGTSGLGALVARHLVECHGVRHLLLVSRRGIGAPGAEGLVRELEGLGALVTVAACDVSEREQVRGLLERVPSEFPLRGVIHSAAVLDDGVVESLDLERLARVMAPKAHAAWHLHELTKDLGVSRFIMFSSVAGLLGNAAQANYAAANCFLDALAAHRHAQGLPATSLAWGGWAQDASELTAQLRDVDLARLARSGFSIMSSEQGLDLFDLASAIDEPLLVPAELSFSALRTRASEGTLPAPLRSLVRAPERQASGSLAKRLAAAPEAEREKITIELVRAHAATILGHASATDVEIDRPFSELGFDSLGAVELRNQLTAATGLRLPPTLIFDHPTIQTLAKHLQTQAEDTTPARSQGVEIDRGALPVGTQPGEAPIPAAGLASLTAPEPAAWDSERGPAALEPAPEPAVLEPERGPAVLEPVPEPAALDSERGPAVLEPERGPAVLEPERGPAVLEPVPEPAALDSERGPAVLEPERGPAVLEPVPEPAALEPEREPAVTELVRGYAAILGRDSGFDPDPRRPFEGLGAMLSRTSEHSEVDDFLGLLSAAAKRRAVFDDAQSLDAAPAAVRLRYRAGSPSIALVSSVVPMSGPHEYVRLARELTGRWNVLGLPLPGFVAGEPMPASLRALVQAQAASMSAAQIGDKFVLGGHSSGGWVAHALAAHLCAEGRPPAAVVFIDTHYPRSPTLGKLAPSVMMTARTPGADRPAVDDARLTALMAYFQLFANWEPPSLPVPRIVVQPRGALTDESESRTYISGAGPEVTVDVPGDHFTMMGKYAASTAKAIEDSIELVQAGA